MMCGRFVYEEPRLAGNEFRIDVSEIDWSPNFNVAPTHKVMAIHEIDGIRKAVPMQWKLIPHWSKTRKLKYPTINARCESIANKSSWREPFRRSRCLIANSGFIEWKKSGKSKQAYLISIKDKTISAFAGIWDTWLDPETGETLESCAIVTTEANALIAPIHERMPVYLHPEEYDEWLDADNHNTEELQRLLKPYPAEVMSFHPISNEIGKVKNNAGELIKPIDV